MCFILLTQQFKSRHKAENRASVQEIKHSGLHLHLNTLGLITDVSSSFLIKMTQCTCWKECYVVEGFLEAVGYGADYQSSSSRLCQDLVGRTTDKSLSVPRCHALLLGMTVTCRLLVIL